MGVVSDWLATDQRVLFRHIRSLDFCHRGQWVAVDAMSEAMLAQAERDAS